MYLQTTPKKSELFRVKSFAVPFDKQFDKQFEDDVSVKSSQLPKLSLVTFILRFGFDEATPSIPSINKISVEPICMYKSTSSILPLSPPTFTK